ncbi:hypothetical protein BDZ88DRAFT_450889 [Geranomyces variabilis]|nr:hypothetical protein BDZ88DRAFT_450889 [Geranomyces variabilis]
MADGEDESTWVNVHQSLLPVGAPVGLYRVNQLGEVRKAGNDVVLKPVLNVQTLRYQHSLAFEGQITAPRRSQIVLIGFFGPPENPSLTIDHVNGVRTDDRLCNLQWMSRVENFSKGGDHPRILTEINMKKKNAGDVVPTWNYASVEVRGHATT